MSITINNAQIREVINQVVNDPDYKKVSEVPVISWHQIRLIIAAYSGFIGSVIAYLAWQVPLWILWPIMGISVYFSFTPLHDATHRALSSNKFLNDALGTISAFLLFPFITTSIYRFLHMSHHRYVGDEEMDPDSILVSLPTKHFPFGLLVLLGVDVVWVYWMFTKGWYRMPTKLRAQLFVTILCLVGLYAGVISNSIFYEFLVLYLIPNRIGIIITGYSFATIQHPEGVKWNELPFESTNLIEGKGSLRLKSLLGQDYHAVHHFLPHVPWYKYQDAYKLGNGIFKKQPIPERPYFGKLEDDAREKILERKKNEVLSVEVKIAAIKEAAKGIKAFTFQSLDGDHLPEFTAGSHIDITLPSGKKRSYSLVNPQFERHHYQIAVKREENGKGGSKEMHQLAVGDVVGVSVPKNNFVLYENVKRYILISGGIGITPMISMAHRLEELDKHFEFHICSKDETEVPFSFELNNWAFAPMVEMHFDKNGKSTIDLSKVLSGPKADTLVYVCGPPGFNKWVKRTALELGWSQEQVKQELFAVDTTEFGPSKPFEVELQKSRKTITVPENMSIIDAVEMHNVSIDYSCLQGTCGTCITKVLKGEVDHRDAVLSEEEKLENTQMCLCVSRAKGNRLVLDL